MYAGPPPPPFQSLSLVKPNTSSTRRTETSVTAVCEPFSKDLYYPACKVTHIPILKLLFLMFEGLVFLTSGREKTPPWAFRHHEAISHPPLGYPCVCCADAPLAPRFSLVLFDTRLAKEPKWLCRNEHQDRRCAQEISEIPGKLHDRMCPIWTAGWEHCWPVHFDRVRRAQSCVERAPGCLGGESGRLRPPHGW